MSKRHLLWTAAFLTLFTFAGHTFGALFGAPPGAPPEAIALYDSMKTISIPLPMGPPKSISAIVFGSDIGLSVFLLISGLMFLVLAIPEDKPSKQTKLILFLNSFGMLAIGVISVFCFFPLPAACTAGAALLGLIALKKA